MCVSLRESENQGKESNTLGVMVIPPGLITRNNTFDISQDNKHRHKISDVIAVSSIISNCAGVESATDRCLGLQEFRQFLRDYQVS